MTKSQIKKIIIKENELIINAIKAINSGGLQICFVVDSRGVLKGSISDGDIRRALLKGITIEDSIKKVINKNPYLIKPSDDHLKIDQEMIKLKINTAPVVNHLKKIIDIKNLDLTILPKKIESPVIIMAGGLGTRLYPLTKTIPKPMIEIAGKPIIEIIIERFIHDGFTDFFLCLNYKSEMIKNHISKKNYTNIGIEFIEEKKRLGTAGALSLIKRKFSQPVIVTNGDILTKTSFLDLLKYHKSQKASATVAVREHIYEVPFGVINYKKNTIKSIIEKPKNTFHVNSGMYVLNPKHLQLVPKNKFFDMPSLINRILDKKFKVSSFLVNEYWLDIGRSSELKRAKKDYE